MYPPSDAVALTELRSDTSLLSAGVYLCLQEEIRQTSKTTLRLSTFCLAKIKVGLEFRDLIKQTP